MKISVITVCFNAAATIRDTLNSVAIQTHDDVEHIVIDGNSTDGTVELVKTYGKRVARLISEPDRGIYDAMNKGIRLASGDLIGFLNADDVFADADALARVAVTFHVPEIGACYGDLLYVKRDGSTPVRYWKSNSFRPGSFGRGWSPAHPTFYLRRSVIVLGLFDISYCLAADVEFMMRYLEKGGIKTSYIPEIQVWMRIGGKTNRSMKNIFLQNKEILRALDVNGIPYNIVLFIINKFINRVWQRAVAHKYRLT